MILGQMTTAYPVSLPSAEGWSFISAQGILIAVGIAVVVSILLGIFRAKKQSVNGVPGWTEVILDAVFALLYVAVMLIYSWQLTLLTLSVIPVLVVLTLTVSPLVRNQLQN